MQQNETSKDVMQQIKEISNQLPTYVRQDIQQRIGDWLISGGDRNADYVHQQLRYAKHVIHMTKSHTEQKVIKETKTSSPIELVALLDKIETALEYYEWNEYMQYVSNEITAYRYGSDHHE